MESHQFRKIFPPALVPIFRFEIYILNQMNQSTFLHIVERLEGFVGKLPEAIQRPILRELTPLKELFLQQRSPRFVFIGNKNEPVPEILVLDFSPPLLPRKKSE